MVYVPMDCGRGLDSFDNHHIPEIRRENHCNKTHKIAGCTVHYHSLLKVNMLESLFLFSGQDDKNQQNNFTSIVVISTTSTMLDLFTFRAIRKT